MRGTHANRMLATMLSASIVVTGFPSGRVVAADGNAQALQAWSDATGQEAPALVTEDDGTTRLSWTTASLEFYHRNVSDGSLLTPFQSGSFQRGTLEGGTETTESIGSKSWFRIAITQSNDRSVLSGPLQLGQLQFGRSDAQQRFDFGDLALMHSTLGTSTQLKGLRWQRSFESVRLAAAAGSIAESWEALGDDTHRMQWRREAVSIRAERNVGAAGIVFATLQGYGDSGSPSADYAVAGRSRGQSATVGANLIRGALAVQTEMAFSHATDAGRGSAADHAFIIDATWTRQTLTLRSGLHDFGPRFASLSVATLPGLRESYVNAAWRANTWSTWTVDLRRTVDRSLPLPEIAALEQPLSTAGRSDAATLQVSLRPPQLSGASLTLAASQSRGRTPDGARNDLASASATVALTRGPWTTQGTVQQSLTWSDTAFGNSALQGVNGSVGRTWADATGAWTVRASLVLQRQSQRFAAGMHSHTQNVGLRLTVQHADRGSASLRVDAGSGRDTLGRPLTLRNLRLDVDRPIHAHLSMRLYIAWNDRYPDLPELAYREQVIGVQFTCPF
ncbi:MAG: hypothetical protein KIT73_01730 [Burkholderiales bacterium]|nr:hypothetical protein [Burkholderiales bacterium]